MSKSRFAENKNIAAKAMEVASQPKVANKRNPLTVWPLLALPIALLIMGVGAFSNQNNFAPVPMTKVDAPVAPAQTKLLSPELKHRSLDDEEVDPRTWRDLDLVMTKADGGKVEIGLLRPLWWINEIGAKQGSTIELSIPEMGASGPTKVLSIKNLAQRSSSSPQTRSDGTVLQPVTGTFKHLSADVYDLRLQGEKKPIGVTSVHPFRSADRKKWVAAGNLKIGERIETRTGTTKVLSYTKRPKPEPVYNIEVHGSHTYFVGKVGGGVWVHNSYLKFGHTDPAALNPTSYSFWKAKSTREIVESLKPGSRAPLIVKTDGTIMNGNTRAKILQERGFDIDKLPREQYTTQADLEDLFPLG